MKKLLNGLTKVENFVMIATFLIMVACEFLQVVNRNITKLPITWFDETAIYSMIYMVLIGTEVGLRDGSQIAVTGAVDKLTGKAKKFVQILAKAIVVMFSAFMLKGAVQLMMIQITTGQLSAALGISMAVPYFAMVISFAMITLVQLIAAIGILVQLIKGEEEVQV